MMKLVNTIRESSIPGALLFVITALVALVAAFLLIALHPAWLGGHVEDVQSQAWVRMIIFGFGLSAVFGAVCRALPLAFGLPLWSQQLVFLHGAFHLSGLLVVVLVPFVPDLPQAPLGPWLITAGSLVFIVNIALTLRGMARPDAASAFIATVLVWLAAVSFLGLPFATEAPLSSLEKTGWSGGWLVLVIAGIFFNTISGLALRLIPLSFGSKPRRTAAAWYALAILNLGVAWMFAAVTYGPPAFLMMCALVFLAGTMICFADSRCSLRERAQPEARALSVEILAAATAMVPIAALVMLHGIAQRMRHGFAPHGATPLDWVTALFALLAVAVPGLIAIIFQLQVIAATEVVRDEKFRFPWLPPAFFAYASGTALVVAGVWGSWKSVTALGAALLALGGFGFLLSFLRDLAYPRDVRP